MNFEKILENGRLWAVVYEENGVNVLDKVFTQWTDYQWLREFFVKHIEDLTTYFHITDIDRAIFDTVDDAGDLECLIMDLDPDANLDKLFRPLVNTSASEVLLSKEKAKGVKWSYQTDCLYVRTRTYVSRIKTVKSGERLFTFSWDSGL